MKLDAIMALAWEKKVPLNLVGQEWARAHDEYIDTCPRVRTPFTEIEYNAHKRNYANGRAIDLIENYGGQK